MRFAQHELVNNLRQSIDDANRRGKPLEEMLALVGAGIEVECPTHICNGRTFTLRFQDVREQIFEADDLADIPGGVADTRWVYTCPHCNSITYVFDAPQGSIQRQWQEILEHLVAGGLRLGKKHVVGKEHKNTF